MEVRFESLAAAIATMPALAEEDSSASEPYVPTAEDVEAAAALEASTLAALAAAEALQTEDEDEIYGMSWELDLEEAEDELVDEDIYGHSFEMDWGVEESELVVDELEDTLETDREAILAAIAALGLAGEEAEEEPLEVSYSFDLFGEEEVEEEDLEFSFSFDGPAGDETVEEEDSLAADLLKAGVVAGAAAAAIDTVAEEDAAEEPKEQEEAAQVEEEFLAPADSEEGESKAALAAAAVGAAILHGEDDEELSEAEELDDSEVEAVDEVVVDEQDLDLEAEAGLAAVGAAAASAAHEAETAEMDEAAVDEEEVEQDTTWRGEYFANVKLQGDPALVREDEEIDFDWGFGSPADELPVDQFSVRWTRMVHFHPGLYRFMVKADDGVRLFVNDRLIISAWYDHGALTFRREMEMAGGPVELRLEYYENVMEAMVQLSWEKID